MEQAGPNVIHNNDIPPQVRKEEVSFLMDADFSPPPPPPRIFPCASKLRRSNLQKRGFSNVKATNDADWNVILFNIDPVLI